MKALILVRVEPKYRIAEKVKEIKGVIDAFSVAGRFDTVALVEVSRVEELKEIALKIHGITGVRRTETLVQVE